jgi:2,3-bisphosphoglycerate-independent phosphoglycerate mutase
MKRRYIIIVGDGMADFPIAELGGKTPLEYANTQYMDRLAYTGRVGRVTTIPAGFTPGSDIGNLSLLGYDPTRFFSGRAPIEAASMGIELGPDDVAFRCNLVTIDNGVMKDYSAGHISTPDAARVISALQKEIGTDEIKFYSGASYRHILVLKNIGAKLVCAPPHDITDQNINDYLPKGDGREQVMSIMNRAREIIAGMDLVNTLGDIRSEEHNYATDIWLWGQGPSVALPTLQERYGLNGSVISAVDLIKGLGKLAGLNVLNVPGATGYLGTNYAGKVDAARHAFENGEDFVYLHIEAPDETSHEGDLQKKIQAIEEFDEYVVKEMFRYKSENSFLRIAIASDHVTALSTRTHDASPVPFCINGYGIAKDCIHNKYCEKAASESAPIDGPAFFEMLIGG